MIKKWGNQKEIPTPKNRWESLNNQVQVHILKEHIVSRVEYLTDSYYNLLYTAIT